MAKIIVYNNDTDRMEVFHRAENEPMPYNEGGTLTVGEFRGKSKSPTLWTTKRVMEAWNATRKAYGAPIPVGYAFRRPWEGGHADQSQHYAGTALDSGQALTNTQRNRLRTLAQQLGVWVYVEPANLTPTWVHTDRRQNPPACPGGGYPSLRRGSRSVYVLILQDSLNSAGYAAGELDGVFGEQTERALKNYQKARGLAADGIAGCAVWRRLMAEVVGNGRKTGTVD
ncbi:MAG: peptidoglycan-binding protein [Oscillospiraceae bacterium]|jgi:hypothetical protein|nr:peptidoglycan-binding protein [Oscillospiraceae bacterium]